eukprot:Phypoly_transcript_02879.p1 GENE.Phypoly_transcript_02879~~Phypoly_transcript_02879.p1  ORF type:complete len:723 (+),score=94.76 Phypoly_transcript_02879:395-2563(+)
MSQMHAQSLRVSSHGSRKLTRILKRESSHPANISINTMDDHHKHENGTLAENENGNGRLAESGEVEKTGNDSMANYSMEGMPLLTSSRDDGDGGERPYEPINDEGIPLLASPKLDGSFRSDVPDEGNSVRMKNMVLFKKFSDEMKKVNEFFVIKEAELQGYYGRLTDAVSAVMAASMNPTKLKELKTAFVEFYRGLSMLQNYVELNREGFRKILKKHQKLTGYRQHKDQYEEVLHQQQFWKSSTWLEMMNSTEALYAKIFNLPRVDRARNELLPIRLQDTSSENNFKLGLGVGACLAFICVIFFLFSHGKVNPEVKWSRFIAVIPVYRAVLIPILAVWLWGCNVYIWTRKRINYTFIFGLDPRSSLDYRRIFKAAAALSAVWLARFFLFVATIMGNLSIFEMRPEIYPLVLIVFNLALILAPFRAMHRRSRFLLFKTIGNVIISPFGDIHFLCLYVGDVLTSLVKTLFDIEYTICYYATGDWLRDDGQKCNDVNRVALPVISALPYFWRLLQCLKRYKYNRHPSNLGNAGKYGVACLVVIVGGINGYQTYPGTWTPMRFVWVAAFIFATLYNYLWDIFMDWDLGKRKYKFLRKQLLYRPHVWVYYYVIFSNLIFRFAWTAYITPTQIYIGINPEFFATILACVEILRRFTWSVFRVEREQVANIGDNRAVTFASLGENVHNPQNLPPITSINGVWTGKGPFDVIVDKLISLSDLDFSNILIY